MGSVKAMKMGAIIGPVKHRNCAIAKRGVTAFYTTQNAYWAKVLKNAPDTVAACFKNVCAKSFGMFSLNDYILDS